MIVWWDSLHQTKKIGSCKRWNAKKLDLIQYIRYNFKFYALMHRTCINNALISSYKINILTIFSLFLRWKKTLFSKIQDLIENLFLGSSTKDIIGKFHFKCKQKSNKKCWKKDWRHEIEPPLHLNIYMKEHYDYNYFK